MCYVIFTIMHYVMLWIPQNDCSRISIGSVARVIGICLHVGVVLCECECHVCVKVTLWKGVYYVVVMQCNTRL